MHDDTIYINGKPVRYGPPELTGIDKDAQPKSWGGHLAAMKDADVYLEGTRVRCGIEGKE
tara:strand:- start:929 stop:1108 length:180 start_codon:yes stop_codon:yes gene_type:complete